MMHLITLGFFLLFLIMFLIDRSKVINGFLFTLFLFSLYGSLLVEADKETNNFLMILFIVITVIGIIFLLIGIFLLLIFCIVNTRTLFKKEGLSLQNSLMLILGLILIYLIASFFVVDQLVQPFAFLVHFSWFVFSYFAFLFVLFLITALLYQIYRPRYNKDYIIVLGSGLIDGYEVPPLLQNRILKALKFYEKQKQKNNKAPKVIFSGGQGMDEAISEAMAMKQFALAHGLPEEDIILEDRSRDTEENMLYSKEIMDQRTPLPYKAIFCTNNFHLLRAGIYAKRAGLNIQGIGAKTAFYYWPNAFIREFIGYISLYKKAHLIFLMIIFSFAIFLHFFVPIVVKTAVSLW